MDKHAVTPGAFAAREMLAELLLLENHAQESLADMKPSEGRAKPVQCSMGAAQAAELRASATVAKHSSRN